MPSQTFDERFLDILGREYPTPSNLPDGWPVYTLLNFAEKNTIKGRTTTHKILCNLMFEKNVLFPYVFQKDKFGPFDPKIQETIEKLEERGEAKETEKKGYTEDNTGPSSYPVRLTGDGVRTYQKDIKPKLETDPFIVSSFKSMLQLTTLPSTRLAGFCHDELLLLNEINVTETRAEWASRRREWKDKILSELSKNRTRWTSYAGVPEEFKFYFLTSIDYFEKILAKENSFKTDQVQSGIVLYNISRFNKLLSKLFDFAKTDRTGPDAEKTFCEISHLFYFVNEYSERIGLFPSVFNADADLLDFMSEGDKKRVTAALKDS